MIDINTIINDAIAAAVAQAIQPLQQEYANKMAEMAEKIATLTDRVAMLENQALVVSNAVDTRITASNAVVDRLHERVATREGALTDRIAALEKRVFEDLGAIIEQEFIASMAVTDAQALTDRIAAVETKLTEADLFTKTTEGHVNKDELLEYLDNQEWFWNKIRNFTDTAVEQAIEEHTETYDHDDMVMKDEIPDMDDYIKREDLDSEVLDAVRDIMEGATVSIRI